ncbi:hypothetical protein VM1G_11834 [Cytospora mali]|uniref:Uncharacterized protein n=1 Tax=Cytospora mali TaxID=578113 RepID=A0A194W6F6_CYTMA|nr:hypothetical protein VM1G_11834 [Valsa mali]
MTEAVATLETLVYPVQVFPFPALDVIPPVVTVPPADVDADVCFAVAVAVAVAAAVVEAVLYTGAETVPNPETLAVPATPTTTNGDAQSHTAMV